MADMHGHLCRVWAWYEIGRADHIEKFILIDPFSFIDDLSLHHRDMRRRPAKTDTAKFEKKLCEFNDFGEFIHSATIILEIHHVVLAIVLCFNNFSFFELSNEEFCESCSIIMVEVGRLWANERIIPLDILEVDRLCASKFFEVIPV